MDDRFDIREHEKKYCDDLWDKMIDESQEQGVRIPFLMMSQFTRIVLFVLETFDKAEPMLKNSLDRLIEFHKGKNEDNL